MKKGLGKPNSQLTTEPRAWHKIFEKRFCQKVFPWKDFYWIYVYQLLSPQERAYHDRLNPVIHGQRKYKIHQFLSRQTIQRLSPELNVIYTLVCLSLTYEDFRQSYAKYHGFSQLTLF